MTWRSWSSRRSRPTTPDELARAAAGLGVDLNPDQLRQLLRFEALLREWNRRINLTAIERPEEIRLKHFLDSLACARAVDLQHCSTLLDVGSGAGLPGLVLKIAFPHLRVTLLDAVRKRLAFAGRAAADLELGPVTLVHARAEDAAQGRWERVELPMGQKAETAALRESFDLVVSRAVARLQVLAEWTLPFARVGGVVLAMKGPEIAEELGEASRALALLGGASATVTALTLPGSDVRRSLVVIPKERSTPSAYPRPAGSARRRPL